VEEIDTMDVERKLAVVLVREVAVVMLVSISIES
jgi:hypothetical protein